MSREGISRFHVIIHAPIVNWTIINNNTHRITTKEIISRLYWIIKLYMYDRGTSFNGKEILSYFGLDIYYCIMMYYRYIQFTVLTESAV